MKIFHLKEHFKLFKTASKKRPATKTEASLDLNIPHKQIPTTNSPPFLTKVMMVDMIKTSHSICSTRQISEKYSKRQENFAERRVVDAVFAALRKYSFVAHLPDDERNRVAGGDDQGFKRQRRPLSYVRLRQQRSEICRSVRPSWLNEYLDDAAYRFRRNYRR